MARKDKHQHPLRLEWRARSELSESGLNWRTHPPQQMEVLGDMLQQVGWAGALLFNESTGRLIDGAARLKVSDNQDELLPVLVGNWTDEQERLILATLDPLARAAEADKQRLGELLASLSEAEGSTGDFLDLLAKQEKLQVEATLNSPADDEGVEEDHEAEIDDEEFAPSELRMIQLFLTTETLPHFLEMTSVLGEEYKTGNPTDTVMEALRREYKPFAVD